MADIYNPSDGTASNKPYSVRGKPSVGRRYYYDKSGTFRWRQFVSHAEACEALPLVDDRRGHEPLVINTGGVLILTGQDAGYILGGTNDEYWWKDGYEDEDLVLKIPNIDLSNYYTIAQVNELINSNVLDTLYKRLSGDGISVVVLEELEGARLVDVIRGGVVLEIITTGSPNGDQVLFDSSTGTLTFGSPFTAFLELVRFLGYNFIEVIPPGGDDYYLDGYITDGYFEGITSGGGSTDSYYISGYIADGYTI